METVRRILSPLKQMKKTTFLVFLVLLNWHLFDLATVIITKEVGDLVESGNIGLIELILYGYVAYYVLTYIVKYLTRKRGILRVGYTVRKILWKQVYEKFFALDITATEKLGTGKIINIISKGVNSWSDILRYIVFNVSKITVQIVMVGYLLYQLGWFYTILFIALLVFLIWFTSWIYDTKVVHLRRKKKNLAVRNAGYMVRMLMSKVEILQIDRVKQEIDRYVDLLGQQEQIAYKNMKWVFWMFNTSLIVMHAFLPLIVVYVIVSLNAGTFSFGLFAGLSVAAGSLGGFILGVTDSYKKIIDQFIDIEKMRALFDTTPTISGYETGEQFQYKTGDIHIENVSFTYETEKKSDKVFSEFSLHIKGEQKTALVGVSGSGKSTLIKLIAGYLRPDIGTICVDGQDLTDISLKSYYKHIGYLTQEPSVFDGTIIDNLTYAVDSGIDDDTLNRYIRLAKCEFIWDFPDGLDTQIGERGIRLSGGQRQRLAIAKIFIKDPDIILLDEPTSALDSFSEEAISEAMHNLFENRTVVIIAHRLQTVKHADDIIVLKEGSIVERGTHDQLVSKKGNYAKMLELQSGF